MEFFTRFVGAKTFIVAALAADSIWAMVGITPGAQDARLVVRSAAEFVAQHTIPAAAWPAFVWAHVTDLGDFFDATDAALLAAIFVAIVAAVVALRELAYEKPRGIFDPGAEVLEVQANGTIHTYRLPKPSLRERLASLTQRLGIASGKPEGDIPSGQKKA